jgi:hypothetical protein
MGPMLAGPLWNGLLKSVAVGVWALKAGDAWMEGESTADRVEEVSE